MSKKKTPVYKPDEAHRPFATLLASKPPSQGGRARSSMISLVLHGLVITGFVYATMAVAEEVTQDEDEIIVEFAPEVNVPPPPPPPPPPDLPTPELQDFKGFQTLELPKVIPPDIPPPASMAEFRATDFSGEGVAGGRGNSTRIADSTMSEAPVSRETPSFTPMTIRPRLTNTDEVQRALVREYPPILRDAGIGGTVEVWLYIDQNGKVENVKVNKGSGYAQLDDAALKVGATMEFTPAYNRDLKVPVWVSIPITFRIG
jgi:periplasmic protein TonB